MSLKYRDSQGTETPVAGLNGTSGELVPSVALVQSGTKISDTTSWTPGESGTFTITLSTPMSDANYEVVVTTDTPRIGTSVHSKTTTGFQVTVMNVSDEGWGQAVTLKWTAFKLMTDTVHEADSAHISQNTANFASAFSEVTSYAVGDYCTYNNVLYRCTTAHTAGVWVAGHFTAVTVGGSFTSFPDYTNPITIPDGTLTWTATEDCYIQALYTTTDTTIGVNSRVVTIDGQLVGVSDATSTVATRQFSGYVKKGQVVSSYDQTLNLGFSQYVKVFPLGS